MSVPQNIQELANKVRNEIYGRDVRESIAKSMEATGEVAEWSRQVAQDIVDGKFDEGELATEIERKLNELEVEYTPRLNSLETDLAQIVTNVKTLGAKGNGVDSDVDAIIQGSQNGVTLGFPDGTYVIDSHVLLENKKRLKWVALGANVNFLDVGIPVKLANGIDDFLPHGIKFKNCDVTFDGFTHNNLINRTSSTARVSDEDKDKIKPFVDFVGGKVTFKNNKTKGMSQGYRRNEFVEGTDYLYNVMDASYYRFYDCEIVNFTNNEAIKGIGGGELYSFGKVNHLNIEFSDYKQEEAVITFWSFAKIIDCGRVKVKELNVQSTSSGSFMDVSGEHIIWENINLDYPNGKFIDITQEWSYANVNTKLIEIKNCKTNANNLAFVSKADRINLKQIDKVIIDNVEWMPEKDSINRHFVSHDYVKELIVKNVDIKNVRFVNEIGSNPPLENIVKFDNVRISSDKALGAGHSLLEVSKETTLSNSYVNQNRINDFEIRDRTVPVAGDLRQSNGKAIIENTKFENTVIKIRANTDFIDCVFHNVIFITDSGSYPSIVMKSPTITYENLDLGINYRPFTIGSLHSFKIVDALEFSGGIINAGGRVFFEINNWNVSDGIEIINTDINVKRLNNDGTEHNSGQVLFNSNSNNDIMPLHLKLKDVNISNSVRMIVNLIDSNKEAILDVDSSSIEPTITSDYKQLFRNSATDSSNITLIMTNNRFNGNSTQNIDSLINRTYKRLVENNNIEW